jgi:8-oxo-dGTP diphosphatase
VIHRPRYDDWSLPKGKLQEGETWEQAALREVAEETGMRCKLGDELSPARYLDRKGRPKLVRYWLMRPVEGSFEPTREVDELRWLDPDRAARLLTHPHDRELVGSLGSGPMASESEPRIAALLSEAADSHHTYEQEELGGARDEGWAAWYARYALDRGLDGMVAQPLSPERLTELLTESTEEHERAGSSEDWASYTAARIANPPG